MFPLIYAIPNPDDLQNYLKDIFDAVAHSNWRFVAAAVLIGLVGLLKKLGQSKIGAKIPKLSAFINTGKGAWLLAVVVGAGAAIGNALAAGKSLGGFSGVLATLGYGAFMGLAAAGLYKGSTEWLSKPPSTAPAEPAGDTTPVERPKG